MMCKAPVLCVYGLPTASCVEPGRAMKGDPA